MPLDLFRSAFADAARALRLLSGRILGVRAQPEPPAALAGGADGDNAAEDGERPSKRARIERHSNRACEDDVGIRCFVGPRSTAFRAVLKARFTDFIVREIALDGSIARLTDLGPGHDPSAEAVPVAEGAEPGAVSDEQRAVLQECLPDAAAVEALVGLVRDTPVEERDDAAVELPAITDKAARTQVHRSVRQAFPFLDSAQGSAPGVIKVFFRSHRDRQHKTGFQFKGWPSDRPKYLRFVLYKENRESNDALAQLAGMLGRISSKRFNMAGTKDKRGVTTQFVTINNMEQERFLSLRNRSRGIVTGNYSYVGHALSMGCLRGNQFAIVMRNVQGSREGIELAIKSLRTHGFINYFGLQRFGSGEARTDLMGAAILRCAWREAVLLILKPKAAQDREGTAAYANYVETGDASTTLGMLDGRRRIERAVLGHLVNNASDYVGAILSIPRQLQLMYVHSVQSLVWNQVVSDRITAHGPLKVLPGDLVRTQRAGGAPADPDAMDTSPDAANPETPSPGDAVRALTAQEAQSGAFSLCDVVFPLPGHDVKYGTPELKAAFDTKLRALDLDPEKCWRNPVRNFELAGGYRPLMVLPTDVEHDFVRYANRDEQLGHTDMDILNEFPPPAGSADPDAPFLALRIQFSLPAGTYATMCIRELTKQETDVASQVQMEEDD